MKTPMGEDAGMMIPILRRCGELVRLKKMDRDGIFRSVLG
jgi:hypothetical protein